MGHDVRWLIEAVAEKHVDTLVFDFDGTIYESSAGVEAQLKPLMSKHAARVLGVSEVDARRVLREYRSTYGSSILGLRAHHDVDAREFYRAVYDDLDLSRMRPRGGLRSELESLRRRAQLVVFTNSNYSFTHRALGLLDLSDIFDGVITVEDNDYVRKPNPEAYEMLFSRLRRLPLQIAMFDDIASSLRVLSTMGAKTILVGNGLRPEPHFVDLHTNDEFAGPPAFVTAATHDLVGFLRAANLALQAT